MVQSGVERVLGYHGLFAGKAIWEIRVDNERRDMHYLYMGLRRFLNKEKFYYLPEGKLEVCHHLHVPRVKHEPKYFLTDFLGTAKAIEIWVGIGPRPRLLK